MYCFNIQVADRKNELERATTQQSQYERLLDEYSNFLETGQDKLQSETVTARDLPQLQDQLAKHKVDQGNLALQKTIGEDIYPRIKITEWMNKSCTHLVECYILSELRSPHSEVRALWPQTVHCSTVFSQT